ncbi:hypothetical protein [Beijerinckia sp. L45]|uniref:hypothetical protein n=1 Tax=Beijerinckia sp. L45 TaxID=1641855 RepID=UPI001FF00589|nr:hypothetical protein [Beijerinckia sp. L45]
MRLALSLTLFLFAVGSAEAAKATRFWNLTANTITKFELAPAGTQNFGADQAKNDKDGAVDHDERLKIIGVTSGAYDVRLADSKGRTCVVKNVAVKEGDVFSIEENQLTDCGK